MENALRDFGVSDLVRTLTQQDWGCPNMGERCGLCSHFTSHLMLPNFFFPPVHFSFCFEDMVYAGIRAAVVKWLMKE